MSRKDYKKGMADAMEAYESFGRKQEAAIRHVGEEVAKAADKVDRLGGKIGELADYITDQEKAELYKLNTPIDIADLEDAEKRILVAVLYQLSADADEVTEEQQNYVRAVQQYLKIYNPQTEIDLDAVENIEDISVQKAVLQATLEFFRLGTHPEEFTEEQEDFLDYFQVNRRTRREIDGYIDAIVETVGIQGLSEKYGFVANQPCSEDVEYADIYPNSHTPVGRIRGFLIGIGLNKYIEDFCEKLVQKCEITNLFQLLDLTEEGLADFGMTSKTDKQFPIELKKAIRKTKDYNILGTIGIPDIGPAQAKTVLKVSGGWKQFVKEMTSDSWRHSFTGYPELMCNELWDSFNLDTKDGFLDTDLVKVLKALEPYVEIITEKFDNPRLGHTGVSPSDTVRQACKNAGIDIVDGKVFDVLLTGSMNSDSDKMVIARKKGIPIYTEDMFMSKYYGGGALSELIIYHF